MGVHQSLIYNTLQISLIKAATKKEYIIDELVIGEITLTRSANTAAALTFEMDRGRISDSRGNLTNIRIVPEEGDSVALIVDGHRIFYGWIREDQTRLGDYTITVTAYDQLYFLANNSDVQNYGNLSASQLTRRIMGDFAGVGYGLYSRGNITATGAVLEGVILDGGSLLDCILDALDKTFEQTGVRHYLFDNYLDLTLCNGNELTEWAGKYARIDQDTVTGECTVKNSIMDLKTQYKAFKESESTGYRETSVTKVPAWIERYGLTQGSIEVAENENTAAVSRMKIQEECRIDTQITVNGVFGSTMMWPGMRVYVDLTTSREGAPLPVRGWFRLTRAVLKFSEGAFLMDLTLYNDPWS